MISLSLRYEDTAIETPCLHSYIPHPDNVLFVFVYFNEAIPRHFDKYRTHEHNDAFEDRLGWILLFPQ